MDSGGRFVAFLSSATNLVTNGIAGGYQIYVRDLLAGTTSLVAINIGGYGPSISLGSSARLNADGRFVAFESLDANLVTGDRNHAADVFVRDLLTNCCELISVRHPALISASGNGWSGGASTALSRDGRFVSFCSDADDLVANDTNGVRDVFVRDMVTGMTSIASVGTNGWAGNNISSDPVMSDDGGYVAFTSSADILVYNDFNNQQDVFIRNLNTQTTLLASVGTNGSSAAGASFAPSISLDGRYVLFHSLARDLVGDPVYPVENLFIRDTVGGTTLALTTRGVLAASMTPDGRFVAFGGLNSNVYVWNQQTAAAILTNPSSPASILAISPDGNRVAYNTTNGLFALDLKENTNLVIGPSLTSSRFGLRFSADSQLLTYAGVFSNTNQVLAYDFRTGTNLLLSSGFSSSLPRGPSDSPDISADGRLVAFRSLATNLLANADSNGVPDVFLLDRLSGETSLLSSGRLAGLPADNRSRAPVFSSDGHTLIFQSMGTDLLPQDMNRFGDVFALSLLYASVLPPVSPGQGPIISWPLRPAETYQVQFKDRLSDPLWQSVSGTVVFSTNTAQVTDLAPAALQRFYRVVATPQ